MYVTIDLCSICDYDSFRCMGMNGPHDNGVIRAR